MRHKALLFLGLFGLLLALAWWRFTPVASLDPPFSEPIPGDPLFHPDLLIQSRSLSQLPRDLLRIPFLSQLLSEDFLFYYQENETRLSLEGTLRRIAYEHHLSWDESLLAHLLDSPAQLALWKNKDGKLKDYLLLLPQGVAARLLQPLAKVAASDRQLQEQGTLTLPDGQTLTLHRLQLQRKSSLYFTTWREQLLISNSPTLLESSAENSRAPALQLFLHHLPQHSLGSSLQLPPLSGKHALTIRTEYLSFGYQHFFPSLQALRFHYDGQQWQTQMLARSPIPAATELWQRVPALPALCLALPVEPARLLELLRPWSDDPQLPSLLTALKPPAALCWYGDSALHTPLLVMPLEQESAAWLPLLGNLFSRAIGSPVPQRDSQKAPPPLQPVVEESCPQGRIWRRMLRSAHGISTPNHPQGHLLATLALCRQTLIFTPDPLLAERALALLEQRYPNVAAQLPAQSAASLLLQPPQLATLLQRTLLESLPPESEKVFRHSVQQRLLPRLSLLENAAPLALHTPQQAKTWENVSWFTY
ncbi:DUF2138 family protein [Candidatus Magnetaquicoccus inordinatus]|uniref:DUF2138 family protein n=1 Tax=Candidatus Magnetaquicoccus inordinatus TaxID=2496818 RepID=UPI00102C5E89|nr:DUF2138 family protein [Candidatus Magnetaquicoccus inordinatus]